MNIDNCIYSKVIESMETSLESALIKREQAIKNSDTKKANEFGRIIKDTLQILNDTEQNYGLNRTNYSIDKTCDLEVVRYYLEWNRTSCLLYNLSNTQITFLPGLSKDEESRKNLENILLSNNKKKIEIHLDINGLGRHIARIIEEMVTCTDNKFTEVRLFGYETSGKVSKSVFKS